MDVMNTAPGACPSSAPGFGAAPPGPPGPAAGGLPGPWHGQPPPRQRHVRAPQEDGAVGLALPAHLPGLLGRRGATGSGGQSEGGARRSGARRPRPAVVFQQTRQLRDVVGGAGQPGTHRAPGGGGFLLCVLQAFW